MVCGSAVCGAPSGGEVGVATDPTGKIAGQFSSESSGVSTADAAEVQSDQSRRFDYVGEIHEMAYQPPESEGLAESFDARWDRAIENLNLSPEMKA